jgi:hypothetical protein
MNNQLKPTPKLPHMDIFRTTIKIEAQKLQISYKDSTLFLGSCFAGNIGNRMDSMKFKTLINPFGVLFNPLSISESLRLLTEEKQFTPKDLFYSGGLWFSFNHHGSFSHPVADICLDNINRQLKLGSVRLRESKILSVTFGTSWVYRYKKIGKIVANCHKLPESDFERFILNPAEIAIEYTSLIQLLRQQIPDLSVIFTISPVRHLRDGMEGNQLSKAILHLAVKQILAENLNCYYFPAFEIMMDDLRDYRFYEQDMVHPNEQAIDYIWERFMEAFMNKDTIAIIRNMEPLYPAINHRPLHPGGKEFKSFCEAQLKFVRELKAKYPYLSFEREEAHFSKLINQ